MSIFRMNNDDSPTRKLRVVPPPDGLAEYVTERENLRNQNRVLRCAVQFALDELDPASQALVRGVLAASLAEVDEMQEEL